MNTAVSNDNSRGHGCSNEWVARREPRPRGVHSLATHARVVRVERKQHAAAQEPCCSRTLALRNDIWVPSIGACRSALCNTTVRDILEPPGACTNHHVATPLPTVRGDTACGPGPTRGGIGNARGTLHACYWNSLLGALTQASILTAAHADTSQLKSKARMVADVV